MSTNKKKIQGGQSITQKEAGFALQCDRKVEAAAKVSWRCGDVIESSECAGSHE